jgi:hypothetical protein
MNVLNKSSKNVPISSSMIILSMGAELFHEDGQTDRYDDANNVFRNFAKAPESNILASSHGSQYIDISNNSVRRTRKKVL